MSIDRRKFLAGLAAGVGGAAMLGQQTVRAQPPYPRKDLSEKPIPQKFKYSSPIIDAHTHYYAKEFVDLCVKEAEQHGAEISGPNKDGYYHIRAFGGGYGAGYFPWGGSTFGQSLSDIEWQRKGMAERPCDMHSLGMTHPKIYWADPAFALRLAEAQNNGLSAIAQKYPKQFIGQIILPLQDPTLSLKELERANKLPGLRGINLAEHINGKNLGDKSFWPVWERCEALGHPLFLHNLDPLANDRLHQGGLNMMNNLGNPFEATVAPMALVLSGTMDAFPKLEVFLPHAGGAFPWLVWRTDYVMQHGNGFPNVKLRRASEYLRRFHYDLILHSPKYHRTMIDMIGADRIVSGTDWPQGMAVWRPIEYVESIPDITQKEAETILCANPARLLKL